MELQVSYEEKRLEIREILRQLCQWKGVKIIEGEVCPDHIHMLVSIPPKMSVSGFMGYLKGKSALLIFQKWGNMKFAYRNREFWCKGYYIDTVGKNTKAIKTYIFASAPSAQISLWPALPRRNKLCIACSDFSIQKCAVCLTTFLCVFLRLNVCF